MNMVRRIKFIKKISKTFLVSIKKNLNICAVPETSLVHWRRKTSKSHCCTLIFCMPQLLATPVKIALEHEMGHQWNNIAGTHLTGVVATGSDLPVRLKITQHVGVCLLCIHPAQCLQMKQK